MKWIVYPLDHPRHRRDQLHPGNLHRADLGEIPDQIPARA